jgi:hypothetical protein
MLKKTERKGKFYIEGKYQKKKRKGKSSIKQCQRARGKKKAIKSHGFTRMINLMQTLFEKKNQ